MSDLTDNTPELDSRLSSAIDYILELSGSTQKDEWYAFVEAAKKFDYSKPSELFDAVRGNPTALEKLLESTNEVHRRIGVKELTRHDLELALDDIEGAGRFGMFNK